MNYSGLVIIIQIIRRIYSITSHINAQLAEAFFIAADQNSRRVGLTSPQFMQMIQTNLRHRIGGCADGQRNQDLITTQRRTLAAQRVGF